MANDIEVYIFILVLTSVVVSGGTVGRLWILRHRRRTFAVNFSDTAAVLFAFAMVVLVGLGFDGVSSELRIQRTYGLDHEDIRSELLTHKYLQEFFAMSIICTTQVWLLKAAFLGYYWSLRETLSDKVKILLYAVSAYTILTYIGVLTLQFTYCRPLPRNWSTGSDRCVAVQTVAGMIAQQGSNVTSDILILIIPMLTIGTFRSNYSLGRKDLYALAIVFGVGIVSIVASIVRFTQVYRVVVNEDSSIVAVRHTLMWALIEKLFAFTAFCLPSLRVFYRKRYSMEVVEKGSGGFTGSISSNV